MKIELDGKTALVTGSTTGIGLAITRGLAQAGARVGVNGRTPARVAQAISQLEEDGLGDRVFPAPGDVGTAAGVAQVLEAAPSQVDILVNNAATFVVAPALESTDDDWTSTFETNVMAGVRLTRALLPSMIERGWGRVLFVSSESAAQPRAEMLAYGMSKAAQLVVARGFAQVASDSGVTVNSLMPGATTSESFTAHLDQMVLAGQASDREEAGRVFVAQAQPSLLRRPTRPEEVASLAIYLCSPQASGTTGAALRVDAGAIRTVL